MNKSELVEKILNMNYGDVYQLNVLNDDDSMVWCTQLTKTRWFDSHIIVIGGSDDSVYVSKNITDFEDEREIVEELINRFLPQARLDQYNSFSLEGEGVLYIKSNIPAFVNKYIDNFKYERHIRK